MRTTMMGLLTAFAVAAFSTVTLLPAGAVTCDSGCDFNFVSGSVTVSGHFMTSGVNVLSTGFSGSVTGTTDAGAITGLVPPPNYYPGGVGNNYYTVSDTFNGSTFDGNGLAFTFGSGNTGNIYDYASAVWFSDYLPDGLGNGPQFNPGIAGTLIVSASPEVSATPLPAALPMFLGGLGGLGLMIRGRKKKAPTHALSMA